MRRVLENAEKTVVECTLARAIATAPVAASRFHNKSTAVHIFIATLNRITAANRINRRTFMRARAARCTCRAKPFGADTRFTPVSTSVRIAEASSHLAV